MAVIDDLRLQIEFDSENFIHFLPKHKAKYFIVDPPNGYKLQPLSTLDYAKTANDIWPYRHEGSLFYINRLIKLNPTIGLFTTDTNELIAWCFRFQSGFVGALQVKDLFLRQGFGHW